MKKCWMLVLCICLALCSSLPLIAATATDYTNYGDKLLAKGDYAEALKYYSYAAKTDPKSWQAYKGIGACYHHQGDDQKALKYVKHAVKLNPSGAGISELQGEIESALGMGGTGASSDGGASAGVSGEEMGGSDSSEKKLVYGFRLGAAGSLVGIELDGTLSSGGATTSASIGAGVGLAAIIRYKLSDKLSIQAEPGFAKKAWVAAYIVPNQYFPLLTDVNEFAVAANYIELPILFGASPSGGGFRPVLLVGPYLGFKIGSSTDVTYTYVDSLGDSHVLDSTGSEGLAAMDMGLLVGLSLEFGSFILDGRYGKGFTSVYDSDYISGTATSYHFGLGWLF